MEGGGHSQLERVGKERPQGVGMGKERPQGVGMGKERPQGVGMGKERPQGVGVGVRSLTKSPFSLAQHREMRGTGCSHLCVSV